MVFVCKQLYFDILLFNDLLIFWLVGWLSQQWILSLLCNRFTNQYWILSTGIEVGWKGWERKCGVKAGWPLTWKTWKSQAIPKCSGKSQGNGKSQGKVRGSEIRCVFSSSKYSKSRFSARALPQTPLGELTMLPHTL